VRDTGNVRPMFSRAARSCVVRSCGVECRVCG